MADKAYDDSIRRDEREKIAYWLECNAELIESYPAPRQTVRLVSFLIGLGLPAEVGTGESE